MKLNTSKNKPYENTCKQPLHEQKRMQPRMNKHKQTQSKHYLSKVNKQTYTAWTKIYMSKNKQTKSQPLNNRKNTQPHKYAQISIIEAEANMNIHKHHKLTEKHMDEWYGWDGSTNKHR